MDQIKDGLTEEVDKYVCSYDSSSQHYKHCQRAAILWKNDFSANIRLDIVECTKRWKNLCCNVFSSIIQFSKATVGWLLATPKRNAAFQSLLLTRTGTPGSQRCESATTSSRFVIAEGLRHRHTSIKCIGHVHSALCRANISSGFSPNK